MFNDSLNFKKPSLITKVVSRGLFIGCYLIVLICVLHPDIRQYLYSQFHKPYRRVVSIVSGPILKDFKMAKVIKVLTHEGMFLEVYGQIQNGVSPLIQKIQLPDNRDGFFTIGDRTSNLFIHDIDEDNLFEIIAPSFDENLIAHLNIFIWNWDLNRLEPKQRPEL